LVSLVEQLIHRLIEPIELIDPIELMKQAAVPNSEPIKPMKPAVRPISL